MNHFLRRMEHSVPVMERSHIWMEHSYFCMTAFIEKTGISIKSMDQRDPVIGVT